VALTLPELLCAASRMALGTKTADVTVIVAATVRQRDDVIRHGRSSDTASLPAIPTQRLSPQAT